MSTPETKVVVVGGGIAGSYASYLLQDLCEVTLIDAKEYFEVRWAALRAYVEPQFANSITVKHKDYLKPGNHDTLVVGKADKVTNSQVHTEDGWQYDYDFVVFCTGMSTPSLEFLGYEKRIQKQIEKYESENKKISSAESILIVGGGPVGVELAGELITRYPQKRITIVHAGKRLLEFMPEKGGEGALKKLISKKVEVILEDKLIVTPEMEESKTYKTDNGKEIEADLVFICVGSKPCTDYLKDDAWQGCIDENGFVVVDEYFRVGKKNNVYAVGDIASIDEAKQGYFAILHVDHVVKSIIALIKGGVDKVDLTKIHSGYKPTPKSKSPAIVSLGWRDGVGVFPNDKYVEGAIPAIIKSKGLFVNRVKGLLGMYGNKSISPVLGNLFTLFSALCPRFNNRY